MQARKSEIAAGEIEFFLILFPMALINAHGDDKGSCIVVGCISFARVWHGEDRMPHNAGVVGQGVKVMSAQSGQVVDRVHRVNCDGSQIVWVVGLLAVTSAQKASALKAAI
jgi:hypothetical protein